MNHILKAHKFINYKKQHKLTPNTSEALHSTTKPIVKRCRSPTVEHASTYIQESPELLVKEREKFTFKTNFTCDLFSL